MTLLLALLLLMTSCAPVTTQIQGYCVPESIYSAWTWEARTGNPARIAVSNITPGVDHAQAQGWDGQEWKPLTHHDGKVFVWRRHFDREPYRYVDLDAWVNEQRKFRRLKWNK